MEYGGYCDNLRTISKELQTTILHLIERHDEGMQHTLQHNSPYTAVLGHKPYVRWSSPRFSCYGPIFGYLAFPTVAKNSPCLSWVPSCISLRKISCPLLTNGIDRALAVLWLVVCRRNLLLSIVLFLDDFLYKNSQLPFALLLLLVLLSLLL